MLLTGLLVISPLQAWNLKGHRLVAEIAYDHMSAHAKLRFDALNHALDIVYPVEDFVSAASWLDMLRYAYTVSWYDKMHYIDKAFSNDGSVLPPVDKVNAIWAINKSIETIQSKKTLPFDKGLALRVLIHVTGDLHQPLHATTKVSARLPEGDAGGNLFRLKHNEVGDNLHSYWDKGAGLLLNNSTLTARQIESAYPCSAFQSSLDSSQWMEESYQLAIKKVYAIQEGHKPSKNYQKTAQKIAKKRIAQAGCRLASLLNQMDLEMNTQNY